LENADSIIDANILEGVGILRDMVKYAIPFQVGEVINGSPLGDIENLEVVEKGMDL